MSQARLNHEDDCLTMLSIRTIAAGEEILNYYGSLSNAELLRRYGYTSHKHARYDVVELHGKDILQAIQELIGPDDRIQQKAEEAGIDVDCTFLLERDAGHPDDSGCLWNPSQAAGIPKGLEKFLGALSCLLRGVDIERWISDDLDDEDQHMLQDDVIKVFRSILDRRLAAYETSIAEDEELRKDLGPNPETRMGKAIEVRLGEKKLILEARVKLTERVRELQGLDILENDHGSE